MEEENQELSPRFRNMQLHDDFNSITPWDVDDTLVLSPQRKNRLRTKKQLMRTRQCKRDSQTFQRKTSIGEIHNLSTDMLNSLHNQRYPPNKQSAAGVQTIESSLLCRRQRKRQTVKFPGIVSSQERYESPVNICMRGRRCRSNNSGIESPYSYGNRSDYHTINISEEIRRARNQVPITELVPKKLQYERMSRKNSLYRWMSNRKESILSNVYEQIKKN